MDKRTFCKLKSEYFKQMLKIFLNYFILVALENHSLYHVMEEQTDYMKGI